MAPQIAAPSCPLQLQCPPAVPWTCLKQPALHSWRQGQCSGQSQASSFASSKSGLLGRTQTSKLCAKRSLLPVGLRPLD
uniref:Uncharacterized protein n=1 Tax=Rhizophora mucronata TaxID=61149 RepID=A0A2P2PPT6_RHIMU